MTYQEEKEKILRSISDDRISSATLAEASLLLDELVQKMVIGDDEKPVPIVPGTWMRSSNWQGFRAMERFRNDLRAEQRQVMSNTEEQSLREKLEDWDAGSHQCEDDCKCDWYVINGKRFFLCTEKHKKFDDLIAIIKQHDEYVIGEDEFVLPGPGYVRIELRAEQRNRAKASYGTEEGKDE